MMRPVTFGNFVRGVDASAGVLTQPRGSVPRSSNLLLTKRGSLHTCDGTALLHAFGGVPAAGRGKMMANFLFAPTGVSRYYLAVAKALDLRLGNPRNLVVVTAAGGSLAAATYVYKVTALDGAGGQTDAFQEVNVVTGANGKNTLTWNIVPNAQAYNVYRSTSSGTESLLVGSATAVLPVPQPAAGALTVTFVDDGTTSQPAITATASWTSVFSGVFTTTVTFSTNIALTLSPGTSIVASGFTGAAAFINGTQFVNSVIDSQHFAVVIFPGSNKGTGSGSGNLALPGVPVSDTTTQQTALYKMPPIVGSPATIPVSYNNANIVALFPADPPFVDGGGGGGSGGGGGGGGGGATGGGTPSGGVPGNLSLIPQIVQFTNQAVLALGNGFPVQVYSDPTTTVNGALTKPITATSVDAFGVVTVTAPGHGITGAQLPACVVLAGVTDTLYNGTFVVISVVDANNFKVRNLAAIGEGASSGGTSTTTTVSLTSSFVPAFPVWTASVSYAVNSIVVPTVTNGHFYKAVQGGTSGAAQPTFPTGTGQRVSDGQIIWQEAGLLNTAAPPPPGASHIQVYAGSLWAWDTSPTNTATGLDGPTSLRMSDVNNLNSWNPINQAFLDKDDGTEGMGLATFTITAQGIPPQGSLVAFKLYASYQIVGVFGSASFAIQRGETDMGCIAPRTIQFLPGFGIGRLTHLGIAVFDTVNDRIISEQVRPYLFPLNDTDVADITVMDATWMSISWAALTANPPTYAVFIPIGNSGGALTRALCFDLVLKAWTPVDLPFPVSCALQARTSSANPVTVLGSFSDGTLHRWQAGDTQWATSAAGVNTPVAVAWSARTPSAASKDPETRLYCRRVVVRGYVDNSAPTSLTIQPRVAGVAQAAQTVTLPATGDIQKQAAVGITHDRFDAIVSGSGQITIDAFGFHLVPKPVGVLAGAVA